MTTNALLWQVAQQASEHCRMHRVVKLEAGRKALDPADTRLKRFEPLELHPDDLFKAGALNELYSAAMLADVKDLRAIVILA